MSCVINADHGSAKIELSSMEETNRFAKVGKVTIMEKECKVTKYVETNLYNVPNQYEATKKAALA